MEGLVRDLWLLWLKQAGQSPFLDKNHSVSVYYSSGFLKPCYSLVFIHIASFILKRGMFYSDLVHWTFHEDFPYFAEDNINRSWQNNSGGYPSIPSAGEFQRYQTAILNQICEAGCKFTFALDQPSLAIRLMKELELPVECYAMYKSISILRGSKVENSESIWKCLTHIGACCVFVAKTYHTSSQFRKIPASPLDFLVPMPADISRPFQSSMTRIIPQKKKGVDKVAFSLFQRYATEKEISLKLVIEPTSDNFEVRRDVQSISGEIDTEDWPGQIKSYFGKDVDGARCPIYANLLLRTGNFVGIEPLRLEKQLRDLEMLLNCYCLSFYSSSEEEVSASEPDQDSSKESFEGESSDSE
jgi:hypothetical protein